MKKRIAVLTVFSILFNLLFLSAQSGNLDENFGTNGWVRNALTTNNDAHNCVVKTTDGNILTGGFSNGYPNRVATFVSYDQMGNLNTSFGTNGVLIVDFGGTRESISDMEVQSDGKIIFISSSYNSSNNYDMIVGRMDTSGVLDTNFGTDGISRITFGSGDERAKAVRIQPDGKIIVAGNTDGGLFRQMAIARLNSDGSLDTTFSGDGKQTLLIHNRSEYFEDVDITPDGKIVAVGGTVLASGSNQGRMAIVKYLSNGELDTTFGTNGVKVLLLEVGSCIANAVTCLNDDNYLVAGYSIGTGTGISFAMIKLDNTGGFDTTFGTNGLVITSIPNSSSEMFAMKVDAQQNSIFGAGRVNIAGAASDFMITKYDMNGMPDVTFGTDGIVTTDFTGSNDLASDFYIDTSNITVVGTSMETSPIVKFAIARYKLENNLSIEEANSISKHKIYPTISNGNFYVTTSQNTVDATISVFDINGRNIKSVGTQLTKSPIALDLKQINKGIYFIEVKTDKGREVTKVIIQ